MLNLVKKWLIPSPKNSAVVTQAYDDDIGLDDGGIAWFDLYGTQDFDFADPNFPMARAYSLYRTNGLAKRFVNFVRDIVVSKGITVTSNDPALNEVFQKFQENPENAWRKTVENFSNFKMIFGETAIEPLINPADGSVTINPLAPTHIRRVKRDPKNNNFDASFIYSLSATHQKKYNVLRPYLKGDLPNTGENNAFFWKHNVLFNEARGNPDMLPIFEIVKAHKDLHIELKNQIARYNWLLLEAKIAGWEELEVPEQQEQTENIADTIRKGGVMAHGKEDDYDFKTPDFNKFDIKDIEVAYLKYLCNCFGFPLHYFATPDNSNRATAQEMDYPTEISMLSHQDKIIDEIRLIFGFVKLAWLKSDMGKFHTENDKMNILIEYPAVSSRLALRQAEGFEKFIGSIDENFMEFPLEFRADLKVQVAKAAGFAFDKLKVLGEVKEPPPEETIPPPNAKKMPKPNLKATSNA